MTSFFAHDLTLNMLCCSPHIVKGAADKKSKTKTGAAASGKDAEEAIDVESVEDEIEVIDLNEEVCCRVCVCVCVCVDVFVAFR